MGGFDDHWMASLSPSPTAFFSSLLSDDIGSKSSENKTESSSLERDVVGPPIEQRGLMERIAARAGFNAPRLNTELTHHQEIHNHSSPYLPFSPGFSPSTLLESPVFLSNSLAQPSPTTGKFQFAPNSYGSENPTLNLDYSEKSKDGFFENMNASSFTFKPVKESSPSLFMGEASRSTLSIQDMEVSVHSETVKPSEFPSQNELIIHQKTEMIEYPSLDEQQDNETDQKAQSGEDGYNWRKYGQKQVKGSEYPRSYYKCTHLNCPVKKKVERSHEGHITEIIYKGAHDHPKPNRRLTGTSDYEMTSSTQSGSSTFSNDESASLTCDTEEDESESKRRRLEAYATEMTGATRASREPRVVVQTTSEVDILDDGYRWRKYGQKVVKGNPNPRSYYKCTSTGCNVRKHVERASHDLKSVITTYEGKHNHDVPAARNTNSQHIHRPEPSVMNNNMGYGSLGRLQVGPSSHGFGFGLNQQGLGSYAMGGTGSSEGHVYPYISQPCSGNDGSFVLPKGEPEVNVYNGSSGYYQIMSTLPLGPQM